MKKTLITLLAIPTLMMGTLALADGKHKGDDCQGPRGDKHGKIDKKGDRGEPGERMIERMSKRLDLSKEQQDSLADLFKDRAEQRQAMMDKTRTLHETLRDLDSTSDTYNQDLQSAKELAASLAVEKIDERASMKADIAKILTPEQLDKFEDAMKHKGERGERGKGPRPEQPMS